MIWFLKKKRCKSMFLTPFQSGLPKDEYRCLLNRGHSRSHFDRHGNVWG